MIPWRIAQHMLQLLFIRIRNPFLHSLHILFVWVGLHESFQIVPDWLDNRSRSLLKMRLETQMKLGESVSQLIKGIYTRISRRKSPYALINSHYRLVCGINIIINSDSYSYI